MYAIGCRICWLPHAWFASLQDDCPGVFGTESRGCRKSLGDSISLHACSHVNMYCCNSTSASLLYLHGQVKLEHDLPIVQQIANEDT